MISRAGRRQNEALTTGPGANSGEPDLSERQEQKRAWRRSKEFAVFKRSAIILGTIAAMLTVTLMVFSSSFRERLLSRYGTESYTNSFGGTSQRTTGLDLVLNMSAFAIGMIVVGLLVAIYYQYGEQQRRYENSTILNQIVSDDVADSSMDLKTLWTGNRRHLKNYHQIVMNYAESTKKSTGLYIMIGFIFIIVTAAFALFAQTTSAAISSAIVATAASVLTGFIAKAVLNNSATSSRELQTFFNHPIEVERALAAERLVGTFETPERRDEAKLLIIQSLTRQRPVERGAYPEQSAANDESSSQPGASEGTDQEDR